MSHPQVHLHLQEASTHHHLYKKNEFLLFHSRKSVFATLLNVILLLFFHVRYYHHDRKKICDLSPRAIEYVVILILHIRYEIYSFTFCSEFDNFNPRKKHPFSLFPSESNSRFVISNKLMKISNSRLSHAPDISVSLQIPKKILVGFEVRNGSLILHVSHS